LTKNGVEKYAVLGAASIVIGSTGSIASARSLLYYANTLPESDLLETERLLEESFKVHRKTHWCPDPKHILKNNNN